MRTKYTKMHIISTENFNKASSVNTKATEPRSRSEWSQQYMQPKVHVKQNDKVPLKFCIIQIIML